jgi:hypothetical protein
MGTEDLKANEPVLGESDMSLSASDEPTLGSGPVPEPGPGLEQGSDNDDGVADFQAIVAGMDALDESQSEESANEPIKAVAKDTQSEIDDIMKEIRDMKEDAPENGPLNPETNLEDGLQRIETEPPKSGSVLEMMDVRTPEQNLEPTQTNGDGNLSLDISGNMRLTLKYVTDGHEVKVDFRNQAIHVQLPDGTELKVPLHSRAGQKSKLAA